MQFAKPPEGFNVERSHKAQAQIATIIQQYPFIEAHIVAIEKRVAQTGHREGTRLDKLIDLSAYLLCVEVSRVIDIQLVYTILGVTLTVQSVRIINQ